VLRIASIQKILNLNQDITTNTDDQDVSAGVIPHNSPITNADGQPIWKVLVFDNLGRDVISTVLRVSDLRAVGVTIHL
jgi:sec1 family domain-containing protein 1